MKALKATWENSESDFDEKIDSANVCFMAHRDDPTKVSLENSLDDDELTMDKLAIFFEELQKHYELSKEQNKKLKKKNELLRNKLDVVFKEKKI